MYLFRHFLLTLLLAVGASPLSAAGLQSPSGAIVLTIAGTIEKHNAGDRAVFDRAMLEALDWRTVRTFTSFTEGEQEFSGPTLASVLAAVAASGDVLRATAINDYAVTLNAADAATHDVLLAMDHNGRPMRVRDKGPIWVVYPLSEAEAQGKPFDAEMIWQLDRIFVE